MIDTSKIDFKTTDGAGGKKILSITKYGESHLELQIIDNANTPYETTKFFCLMPEQIKKLRNWLWKIENTTQEPAWLETLWNVDARLAEAAEVELKNWGILTNDNKTNT